MNTTEKNNVTKSGQLTMPVETVKRGRPVDPNSARQARLAKPKTGRTGRPINPESARQARLAKPKTGRTGRPINPNSARQERLAKVGTVKRGRPSTKNVEAEVEVITYKIDKKGKLRNLKGHLISNEVKKQAEEGKVRLELA